MRATRPGGRWPGRPPAQRGHELVRLITRMVVWQTVAAAAVGLPFSKRHLPSILITLAMVAALCGLALLVHSGTRTAWLVAVAFEMAFFGYGLSRFITARYVGGTLFAILIAGALVQPAVARAYGMAAADRQPQRRDDTGLPDPAGKAYGG